MHKILTAIIIAAIIIIPFNSMAKQEKSEVLCQDRWAEEFNKIDKEWLKSLAELLSQKADTTDLINIGIQDFRSYSCRLRSVCEITRKSLLRKKPKENINIRIIGCDKTTSLPYEQCSAAKEKDFLSLSEECDNEVIKKIRISKPYFIHMIKFDAAHKKTGALVVRYKEILDEIRNNLFEQIRRFVSSIKEFSEKVSCTIRQCD